MGQNRTVYIGFKRIGFDKMPLQVQSLKADHVESTTYPAVRLWSQSNRGTANRLEAVDQSPQISGQSSTRDRLLRSRYSFRRYCRAVDNLVTSTSRSRSRRWRHHNLEIGKEANYDGNSAKINMYIVIKRWRFSWKSHWGNGGCNTACEKRKPLYLCNNLRNWCSIFGKFKCIFYTLSYK